MAQVKNISHKSPFQTAAAQMVPALEISGLNFSYHDNGAERSGARSGAAGTSRRDQVLSDVSYTLPQGALLAMLGPNGGGKTTLLRLILGFLKPDSGTLKIFGQAPDKVREHLGYVPQFTTARLDFPATVEEVVLMGAAKCERGGWARRAGRWLCRMGGYWGVGEQDRQKAHELLKRLGLANYSRRLMSELSGGERQRVFIARALMGWTREEPFLLLLDEPTSNVDPAGKFCFYDFLYSLRGQITSILVSHDLTTASGIFSHLAIINHNLVEAQPVSQDDNSGITRSQLGFSAADGLAHILGRHEHDRPCPVAAFIKATTPSERGSE